MILSIFSVYGSTFASDATSRFITIDEELLYHIKIFALGIAVLLNFSSYVHSVFSKSILAKFVPENIQATSEGIRNALFQLSFLVGGLTVVFPSKFLSETMFLMAFVISGCTAWYISEQEIFMNIKVISVKYSKLRCKY